MKKDIITELPIVPEEYDVEWYSKVDYSVINSRMTETERRFINGLIRYYQPSSLLELGVRFGGGGCNLLNAISDRADAQLLSIDITNEDTHPWLGENAKRLFPEFIGDKWRYIAGKDACEVLDDCNTMFDFVVIDTAHIHPVESLNFLTVLPYLKNGAIVVLHDIEVHYVNNSEQASRILWSSLVAPKIMPLKSYLFNESIHYVINIGAFQITEDTRKYIGNVFYNLSLPWGINNLRIKKFTSYFAWHYENDLVQIWRKNYSLALTKHISNNATFNEEHLRTAMYRLRNDSCKSLLFCDAGTNMRNILYTLDVLEIEFDFPIWDMHAEKIDNLSGHKVSVPNFSTPAVWGQIVVVTILDDKIADEVTNKLKALGYKVFHSSKFFELAVKGVI
jgi:predicted O-methyltransferase YrrM